MFLFRMPVHAVYNYCYMGTLDHVQDSVIILKNNTTSTAHLNVQFYPPADPNISA